MAARVAESFGARDWDYSWLYHVRARLSVRQLEKTYVDLINPQNRQIIKELCSFTENKRNANQRYDFFTSAQLRFKIPYLLSNF